MTSFGDSSLRRRAAWPDLLWGAWLTIQLSASAMTLGLLVAIAGVLGKTMGPKPVRWLVDDPQALIPTEHLICQDRDR